jgi:NADH dehydrogenase
MGKRSILLAFEHADATDDPEEHRRLLTFVIVGAGPTGVELAGIKLAMDIRNIDPREARVLLIEAGERVLPSLPAFLSARAVGTPHTWRRGADRHGGDAV